MSAPATEPELQFHQPDETLTQGKRNRGPARRYPEDIASSDEMVTLVQFALDGANRADREAFILHAIEGFSLDEIGVITDRKPDQVRSSIESAREHLRHLVPLASRFSQRAAS